jgi:hypothetical protein
MLGRINKVFIAGSPLVHAAVDSQLRDAFQYLFIFQWYISMEHIIVSITESALSLFNMNSTS